MRDVRRRYCTTEDLLTVFGVVLRREAAEVDTAETEKLWSQRRAERR